jgi:hypothetical protein
LVIDTATRYACVAVSPEGAGLGALVGRGVAGVVVRGVGVVGVVLLDELEDAGVVEVPVVLVVLVVLASFGCVKGSRAGPLRLETVAVLWTLTAGTAESWVTGTASGVTCATGGALVFFARITGIATTAASNTTATGHSRFSRRSEKIGSRKLIASEA